MIGIHVEAHLKITKRGWRKKANEDYIYTRLCTIILNKSQYRPGKDYKQDH